MAEENKEESKPYEEPKVTVFQAMKRRIEVDSELNWTTSEMIFRPYLERCNDEMNQLSFREVWNRRKAQQVHISNGIKSGEYRKLDPEYDRLMDCHEKYQALRFMYFSTFVEGIRECRKKCDMDHPPGMTASFSKFFCKRACARYDLEDMQTITEYVKDKMARDDPLEQ